MRCFFRSLTGKPLIGPRQGLQTYRLFFQPSCPLFLVSARRVALMLFLSCISAMLVRFVRRMVSLAPVGLLILYVDAILLILCSGAPASRCLSLPIFTTTLSMSRLRRSTEAPMSRNWPIFCVPVVRSRPACCRIVGVDIGRAVACPVTRRTNKSRCLSLSDLTDGGPGRMVAATIASRYSIYSVLLLTFAAGSF